jgi:hypothetical protein
LHGLTGPRSGRCISSTDGEPIERMAPQHLADRLASSSFGACEIRCLWIPPFNLLEWGERLTKHPRTRTRAPTAADFRFIDQVLDYTR